MLSESELKEAEYIKKVRADIAEKKKKGLSVWGKADQLEVTDKKSNWHYRWINRNESRIKKVKDRGYIFVTKDSGLDVDFVTPVDTCEGAVCCNDLVLMAIPQVLRDERDSELEELTDKRTRSLKSEVGRELKGIGAEVEGKIVIE